MFRASYGVCYALHRIKISFPNKTEAGLSSREREKTATALLRDLWVCAGKIRIDLPGGKGVTEGTHAGTLIAMQPECLLKAAVILRLSSLEFGKVRQEVIWQ